MGLIRDLLRAVLAEVKPKTYASAGTSKEAKETWAESGAQGRERQTAASPGTATSPNGGNVKQAGKRGRYRAAFAMARDGRERRARSLSLTHVLAYTLVIVGAIFLGLTLGGKYPDSKAVLQEAGIWTDYVVKYALYLWAGLAGVAAVLLANRALAAGRSTLPSQAILALTVLSVLATMGLTIYLLTVGVGYSAGDYILNVLMLIQRLLYAAVACMALVTLYEADRDEAVAAHVAHAQGVGGAPAAAKPTDEAGYAVV